MVVPPAFKRGFGDSLMSKNDLSLEEACRQWFVVQTQPGKERLANWHLSNQGFSTFLPLQRRLRRQSRGMHSVISPFFPGYLFVALDLERQRWRSINGTIGVVRLVSVGRNSNGLPTPLPSGLVERIQEASGPDGEVRFAEQFSIGDPVRIVGGPFDALCGVLEAAKGTDRVMILLNMLSSATRVEVKRDCLMAV